MDFVVVLGVLESRPLKISDRFAAQELLPPLEANYGLGFIHIQPGYACIISNTLNSQLFSQLECGLADMQGLMA